MCAKTSASKKAKGTRLEKDVAALYRKYKIDETAQRMPLSGADSHFKSDIYKRFDYEWSDECKNHETIKLRDFWAQTERDAGFTKNPVLHISSNFRPIVTVIRQSDFEGLLDNEDRIILIDISDKKRFNFWDYASLCTDINPVGTVIYCTIPDESLVIMTINSYMTLRKENMPVVDK